MILNSHADIDGHMTMYYLVGAKNSIKFSRQKNPFIVAEVEIQMHVHKIDLN